MSKDNPPPEQVSRGYISQEARELLPSAKLRDLLNEVAPGEVLDPEVEEFLQEHAEGFVDGVTEFACRLAKNRKSKTLEAQDIQAYLERNWNMRVPGYGEDRRPMRKPTTSAAHNARLQMIQKAKMNMANNAK
mmetsp:Transcript_12012/g.36622  ORF Transcript_12012/g.36622 Transcript_12012/m.36622 type:complete len:133 (+) Transcript_12012:331-729(+)